MPAVSPSPHAELLRRLDELPIGVHERRVAQAQARLAFGLVDALFDAFHGVRRWIATFRHDLPRERRAH